MYVGYCDKMSWVKENKKAITRSPKIDADASQEIYDELANGESFSLSIVSLSEHLDIDVGELPTPNTLQRWIANVIESDEDYDFSVGKTSEGDYTFRKREKATSKTQKTTEN